MAADLGTYRLPKVEFDQYVTLPSSLGLFVTFHFCPPQWRLQGTVHLSSQYPIPFFSVWNVHGSHVVRICWIVTYDCFYLHVFHPSLWF